MCAGGSYSSVAGATACAGLCSAGLFSTAVGASSSNACAACGPGTFGLWAGVSACLVCNAGTYVSGVGASLGPYVPPTPGALVAYNRHAPVKLTAGIGQYCSYYVPGPSPTASICGNGNLMTCAGVNAWPYLCPTPLTYNYTVCGITDTDYGRSICNLYSREFQACPWSVDEGCNMLNATDIMYEDPVCTATCRSVMLGSSTWTCDEGCAELSPCTNADPNGVFIGAGGTAPDSCPIACNPGYALVGGACVCAVATGCSGQGSSPCAACAAGTYASGVAASSCVRCAAGSYRADNVSGDACAACAPGTYASGAGATACDACDMGTVFSKTATGATSASVCLRCSAGAYASVDSNACVNCTVGTYATASGLTSPAGCAACAAGAVAPTRGATACAVCAAGAYASGQVCAACPAGNYSSSPGATACLTCPANTYATLPLASAGCEVCPAHTSSPPWTKSVLGCLCDAGYACAYTKRIHATVTLRNTSLANFTAEMQSALLSAVAVAAGVPTSSVTLLSSWTAGRRLLMASSNVRFIIDGAEALDEARLHAHWNRRRRMMMTRPSHHHHHHQIEAVHWVPRHAVRVISKRSRPQGEDQTASTPGGFAWPSGATHRAPD